MPRSPGKDKASFPGASALARTATMLPAGFALVLVARLLTNVSYRLVFPFLPRIADGVGVSLATWESPSLSET